MSFSRIAGSGRTQVRTSPSSSPVRDQMEGATNGEAMTDTVAGDHRQADAPLVSVMIVTYNQERWVAETIRSAVDQDYDNLEVIVADDGSSDGTRVGHITANGKYRRLMTSKPLCLCGIAGQGHGTICRAL